MMLDDCTEIVMSMPSSMATAPPPVPSTLLSDRSTRSATSLRMFLVMKVERSRTTTSPASTISVPRTLPLGAEAVEAVLDPADGFLDPLP